MKKIKLPATMSTALTRSKIKLAKKAPAIYLAVGLISGAAGLVMACKASTKISKVVDDHKKAVEEIQEEVAKDNPEVYSKEDGVKDMQITTVQTGVKVAKLYAPAAALCTLSLVSILASHNLLKKRNAALTAAYAAVDKTFKDYRKNVIENLGKDADIKFRHGINTVEETTENPDGTTTTTETAIVKAVSDYERTFDKKSRMYEGVLEYDLMTLRAQESLANDILTAHGVLFLNDVLELLDLPKTKAGQIVGWTYDKNGNNPNGDNFVDFRTTVVNEGTNPVILLDFNCDGDVLSMID